MSIAESIAEEDTQLSRSAVDSPHQALAFRAGGDWPKTTRLLPWMLAVFLVLLFLAPIDATRVPITLPVDSTIDRFVILALILVWLLALGAGTSYGPVWRRSRISIGITLLLGIATASVVLNLTKVARAEELQLAVKQLALLCSFAALFLIVATSVRKRELAHFGVLLIGLASLTALGTIVEYRTGTNYFYELIAKLPLLSVSPPPPDPPFGRPSIVGPTEHGLAVATMLGLIMPLALVALMNSKTRGRKALYAVAFGLLLAGSIATLRKTAIVVPAVALLVLLIYTPRRMVRLLPLAIVMLVFVKLIAPGALSGIRFQLSSDSEHSTAARTADYAAIVPDILTHPLIGRGYGTYDPKIYLQTNQVERHRFLDNQLLKLLIEIGIAGVAMYLCLGVLAITSLHATARATDFARAGPALAILAATWAFFVANFLFDTLSFSQVPYLFFFLLGLGVVATASPRLRLGRTHSPWGPVEAAQSPMEVNLVAPGQELLHSGP